MDPLLDSFEEILRTFLIRCMLSEIKKDLVVEWAPERLSTIKPLFNSCFQGRTPSVLDVSVFLIAWAHDHEPIWIQCDTHYLYKVYGEFAALSTVLSRFELNMALVDKDGMGLKLLRRIPRYGFKNTEPLLRDWLRSLLP